MRRVGFSALFVLGVAAGVILGLRASGTAAGDVLIVVGLLVVGLLASGILLGAGFFIAGKVKAPIQSGRLERATDQLTSKEESSGLTAGSPIAPLPVALFSPMAQSKVEELDLSSVHHAHSAQPRTKHLKPAPDARRVSSSCRDGKWVVRVQNILPNESLELALALPSAASISARIPFRKSLEDARVQAWLIASGLVLAVFGQMAMNRSQPFLDLSSLYTRLDQIFRLQFPNREAPLEGFILLLVSGVLFALGVRRVQSWQVGQTDDNSLNGRGAGKPMSAGILIGLPVLALLLSALVWRTLGSNSYAPSLPALWLGSFFLLGVFFWRLDRQRGASLRIQLTRNEAVLIAVIVIAGFIVLSYNLTDIPQVIWGDEGAHYDVAWGIANGRPNANIFDFGVYSFPLLHSYYVALFLKVLGYSIFAWRMSSVVAGVAALIPTYLLGRDLFNKQVGFLAAVLMIVSPLFLVYGRMGYHLILSVFPVVAALWFFHMAWQRRSFFFAFLSGLINGIGLYSYSPVQAGMFIIGLYGLYLIVTRRVKFWTMVWLGLVYGLSVVLAYGPHIIWGMADSPQTLSYKTAEGVFNNVFQVRALFGDQDPFQYYPPINVYGQVLFFNPPLYAKVLTRAALRTLVAFNDETLMREHFLTTSMAGPIAGIFFFLGIVYVHFKIRREAFGLLAIWFWMCFLLLNVLNQTPPRPTHSMPLIPLMAIVTAVVLFLIAGFLKSLLSSRLAWGTIAAIVLAILIFGVRQYFVIAQDQVRPELENIMTWAEVDAKEPTKVVYLYQDNPDHYLYAPWAIEHLATKATFELLPLNELAAKRADFENSGLHYYFFAAPEISDRALNLLDQLYGSGQSQKYWAYGGRFLGISYHIDRE